MAVILINTVTIAVEANSGGDHKIEALFEPLDLVFLVVYCLEFILKETNAPAFFRKFEIPMTIFQVFAEPFTYWKSNYNRFDFLILIVTLVEFFQNFFVEGGGADVTYLRVLRGFHTFLIM